MKLPKPKLTKREREQAQAQRAVDFWINGDKANVLEWIGNKAYRLNLVYTKMSGEIGIYVAHEFMLDALKASQHWRAV